MKNFAYFMVGLICLPLRGIALLVTYIRDYGKGFIDMCKFEKRLKQNLKKD